MQDSNATNSPMRRIDYVIWAACAAGIITIILDVLVWKP
jgi:hypothetical protein